jgi:ribosomal protein S18 acetylase RimI-like enzyme
MSAVIISTYSSSDLTQVEEIFLESSVKKIFKDDEEKRQFHWKYLGSYLERSPELALVAKKDGKVLGYVCGSLVTDFEMQPHMKIFEDLLRKYSSHLHINCHFESRGLGIGSLLILELEKRLQALNTFGLHIMTGPDSKNRSFYHKLGFSFEEKRLFEDRPILMMGKTLTALVRHI